MPSYWDGGSQGPVMCVSLVTYHNHVVCPQGNHCEVSRFEGLKIEYISLNHCLQRDMTCDHHTTVSLLAMII